MKEKIYQEYDIGDSCFYCFYDTCVPVSIVEKVDEVFYKVKNINGEESICGNYNLYPYRTRIDMEYKMLKEINEFINRRFYFSKEDFKNSSYYFCKLLQVKFPNLEIVYIKNKEYFVCCSGYLYYDVFGLYVPATDDELYSFNQYWVGEYKDHDRITNIHIV